MKRYAPQPISHPAGGPTVYGVLDLAADFYAVISGRAVRTPAKMMVTHMRDYTKPEAQQVADWLNGHDQPLATMNMDDFPRHYRRA